MPLCPKLFKYRDCVGHSAAKRVISVAKQHTLVGIHLRISSECVQFAWKAHDPTVGVRTRYRHVKHLACKHVGRRLTACYHGSPCAVNSSVGSLRSSQSELCNRAALCRIDDLCRLSCYQSLVIEYAKYRRLDELRLKHLCAHRKYRLLRKYHRTFRHCVYIAVELKIFEQPQKVLVKDIERSQISYVVVLKFEI